MDLTIHAHTNSGHTFRLKGKGITSKQRTGDLLVRVEIMLESRAPEFEEMMRRWRDDKPYNPRKNIK
jgi:DnaJ-class molecular chaperone